MFFKTFLTSLQLFAYYPLLFDRSEETVQAKKEMVIEGFEELNADLKGSYLGGWWWLWKPSVSVLFLLIMSSRS